jgi:hypothetical protein
MTPLFLTALLAGTQPICGKEVVSASSPVLTLYARDGSKAAEIKVKNNSLPAPLPVAQCGPTKVLVRYQGQLLVAERWEVVFDQSLEINCDKPAVGSTDARTGVGAINGLTRLACRPPPPPPAPRTPPRKRGKKR